MFADKKRGQKKREGEREGNKKGQEEKKMERWRKVIYWIKEINLALHRTSLMVYFGINQLFSESNGYKSLQIFFIQSNDKLKRFPFNLVEILKRRKIQIYLYFRNIVFPFPYNTQTFAQYERRERGKFSHPFK